MRRGSPLRAFKDGVKGFFKNGLMSFASVCILTSCMLIMGSAMLVVANLNQFVVQMQQQNEIVVFIDESATEAEVKAMGEKLDGIPNIGEVRKRKLLARFKSVKAIREAELPALQSELGRAVGRAVYDHFHPKEETP